MPKFYQHIVDHRETVEDLDGSNFVDAAAAMADAEIGGREILAERIMANEIVDGQRIEVRDQNGVLVGVIRLRDLIRLDE